MGVAWLSGDHCTPEQASECSLNVWEGECTELAGTMSHRLTVPSSAPAASNEGWKVAHATLPMEGGAPPERCERSTGWSSLATTATAPCTRWIRISPHEEEEATCTSLGFQEMESTPGRVREGGGHGERYGR